MEPFYKDEKNWEAFEKEIESWKGTRFSKSASIKRCKKGVRADCVGFVYCPNVAVGSIGTVQIPGYSTHEGGVETWHLLERSMDGIPGLVKIWRKTETLEILSPRDGIIIPRGSSPELPMELLMRGDWVSGSRGKNYNHLSYYDGDKNLRHLTEQNGVSTSNIFAPDYRNNILAIYRPYGRT